MQVCLVWASRGVKWHYVTAALRTSALLNAKELDHFLRRGDVMLRSRFSSCYCNAAVRTDRTAVSHLTQEEPQAGDDTRTLANWAQTWRTRWVNHPSKGLRSPVRFLGIRPENLTEVHQNHVLFIEHSVTAAAVWSGWVRWFKHLWLCVSSQPRFSSSKLIISGELISECCSFLSQFIIKMFLHRLIITSAANTHTHTLCDRCYWIILSVRQVQTVAFTA